LSKKRSAVRNYTEYFLLRLVSGIVCVLPERAAWSFGKVLGRGLYFVDRPHRKVATENLSAAFPAKTPHAIKGHVKEVFENLGLVLVESLRVRKMLALGIERFVEKPDLSEVREAVDAGKGMIIATAHISNWEIAGHATSMMITPLKSVARPLENPLVEKYIDRIRRLSGQEIIRKRGAVRGMVKALNSGHSVAMLMDQDARSHGVFVDFFGRPASTWPTAAALALKHGCPIVVGFVERTGQPFRYRLVVDSVFRPRPTADRQADLQRLTQQITTRLEERIRQSPGEWLWIHRRWKTTPEQKEKRLKAKGRAHNRENSLTQKDRSRTSRARHRAQEQRFRPSDSKPPTHCSGLPEGNIE